MKRRHFLTVAAGSANLVDAQGAQGDPWGTAAGYPSGWGDPPGLSRHLDRRVANYSGGFEQMVRTRTIQCGAETPLAQRPMDNLRYRWGLFSSTPDEYLDRYPTTALMIAQRGEILLEKYRFGRSAEMRMSGWSMAKSVTSLLLGIAMDRGLIASLDDPAQGYAPALAGTLHGSVTLRNLSNMSSGADIVHARDNQTIYPRALSDRNSSLSAVVAAWNQAAETQGTRFNYNELCPLAIGMVLRAVTGKSLSAFAQEALWVPMGAQANATWFTDSKGDEFNCIGFAAQLRDWARLGLLVAQQGTVDGRQVVGRAWMQDYSRWSADEQQVRPGALPGRAGPLSGGYKRFVWHNKPDGSQPAFVGADGQRIYIDIPTQTVLVHTAVAEQGEWQQELYALFKAAVDSALKR